MAESRQKQPSTSCTALAGAMLAEILRGKYECPEDFDALAQRLEAAIQNT